MNCEQAREQMVDRWVQGIAEDARIELDTHCRSCESCRQEAEVMESIWGALGAFPVEEPGAVVRARFHTMLEAYRIGAEQSPVSRQSRGMWSRLTGWWNRQDGMGWRPALGMACATLVVGLTAGYYVSPRKSDPEKLAR